jgi:maltokinase
VTGFAGESRHELPEGVAEMIAGYLGAQRWFAGDPKPDPDTVTVEWSRRLWGQPDSVVLWQAIVHAAGDAYQLVLGQRPGSDPAEFLHGHEEGVLGFSGTSYFYDAAHDAELAKVLLGIASAGREEADRARPMAAEQSNTSLVFDDRLILKLFRRLHPGHNPDLEVTYALYETGFRHVAEPLVSWREEPYDLAFGQRFLAGGSEGWALALTSLRDLYHSDFEDPAELGGDFASEARRLGVMTAEMHLALVDAFGPGDVALESRRATWTQLVDSICQRLPEASEAAGRDLVGPADELVARLYAITDPGPAGRVHGDYHLGQVMRTDDGWYVLDFEGEPTKALAQRVAPASPLKDVSGMLRSFDYAARYALTEHPVPDQAELEPRALAWEVHNRQAFLDGYRSVNAVQSLLPDADVLPAVLMAFELDKALYELNYERGHRPDWVSIPLHAINRLIDGETGGQE